MKLLLVLTALLLAPNSHLVGQVHSVPPGMVDGAKNPELIPRTVAYQSLFLIVGDGFSERQKSGNYFYMKPAGLSTEQMDFVIRAGVKYRIANDEAAIEIGNVKKANSVRPYPETVRLQFDAIIQGLDRTADDLRRGLEASLGAEGFQKLDRFVETKVKAGTEYYKGSRQ